ncbi:DEAD/DEAH box helicase family protein [Butyrivibrio sp.]|uniref:DEAD/DEAH box helicase family protein n=1 Tax=Butyrivibrio sp. TaxID=28121 RepID=UPI0025C67068|nr:DEAD/DEAH box helicase family protein [Butyrivibrio sp.]MBE5838078.1 DEAD/DEAH box helicase [Butyrivibrio sp.]
MSYKELEIGNSYISKGNNNIADSFLVPVLKHTVKYKRSVGFFSSGVINEISEGIMALVRNHGTIQLIASPELSEADIEAINLGYEQRQKYIEDRFSDEFVQEVEKLDDTKLQFLCELIRKNILDIKIAVTDRNGIYHDKLGILQDFDGNKIVFYGSSNSSYSGYRGNYEKIRVSKSWVPGFADIVSEEEQEFDQLWNNSNEYVQVFEFKETAEKKLLEVIERRSSGAKSNNVIKLRDYQQDAIAAWVRNNYHGFYVMATGTGKTWTAIFSAKKLIETEQCMVTICAPYKHLVKQWAEDVTKAFPEAKIVLVSSENPEWDKQITNEIVRSKYDPNQQLIIITTIASFKMQRYQDIIATFSGKKLLIVDEAHRFTVRPSDYDYLLGLSATPFSGSSAERGNELMEYFGGQVFSLTIEDALDRGYLVPYYYRPIYVYATREEEDKFNGFSRIILSCFRNGVCINPDLLVKTLRNRLRVISMAEEKQTHIDDIINNVKERNNVVVYCGDGRLMDSEQGEIRHIQSIKKMLSRHGYKASQFTAQENIKDRMELVDSFNKGEITALAAIRCLDEGINIPSIKSALILSSNDDYREFVQRRGRILRTYNGKKYATIYDVIVLPSDNCDQWAKIEFRRFLEYARLALNWNELELELEDQLSHYGLSVEDIDVYDYEDMEETIDE